METCRASAIEPGTENGKIGHKRKNSSVTVHGRGPCHGLAVAPPTAVAPATVWPWGVLASAQKSDFSIRPVSIREPKSQNPKNAILYSISTFWHATIATALSVFPYDAPNEKVNYGPGRKSQPWARSGQKVNSDQIHCFLALNPDLQSDYHSEHYITLRSKTTNMPLGTISVEMTKMPLALNYYLTPFFKT